MIYSDQTVADNYDKDRFNSPAGRLFDQIEREIVEGVAAEIPANSIALDAGTGTGRFAVMLSSLGMRLLGTDISLPMLLHAREKSQRAESNRVSLVRGNVFHLPIRTGAADLIVSLRVLSQLGTTRAQMAAVRELCRVCAPGGRILFDVINQTSLAILSGSGTQSLVHLQHVEQAISEIQGVRVRLVLGRLALSQTAFGICPLKFFPTLLRIDRLLSERLPKFCTRVYYILAK